jgi:hypothetical protein
VASSLKWYGLDVLITHAPPEGIHDGSGAHAGFRAFRWLIDRFPPRYLIHGMFTATTVLIQTSKHEWNVLWSLIRQDTEY